LISALPVALRKLMTHAPDAGVQTIKYYLSHSSGRQVAKRCGTLAKIGIECMAQCSAWLDLWFVERDQKRPRTALLLLT
jgi:hypothetical protein